MNDVSSVPDRDEAVLLQFQQDYETAANPEAVLDDYCARHPRLTRRLRSRAAMPRMLDASRAEPPEPLPERLGEFRILRRIGHGGMGEIYLAEHERLGRKVAVKVIRPDRTSPEARDRFRREQRALAHLHQTHIVSIYGAGEDGPAHWFAMPYIDGAALHHVIRTALELETAQPHSQTPPLDKLAEKIAARSDHGVAVNPDVLARESTRAESPAAVAVSSSPSAGNGRLKLSGPYYRSVATTLADAAEALQHAHEAGLVHRDVKPSNLMVDRNSHCWVIDFGLTGCLANGNGKAVASDPVLATEPLTVGGILGTPQYMSPEQWTGGMIDARADVWGLGVVLYELLTLRRAFDGKTHEEIRAKVLTEEPAGPRTLTADMPADLDAICRKAIRKGSDQRYPTANAFAEDLRRWLHGQPTVARRVWPHQ